MSDERSEPVEKASCGEAPLFVLGLLQAHDATRFLEHAETCVVCRDEIAALGPAVDALAESVPPLRAPRELRQRVIGAVQADAAAAEAITGARAKRAERSARARRFQPRRLALAAGSSVLLAAGCALGALVIASPGSPKTTTLSAQVSIRGASAELHRSGSQTWLTVSNMPQPGKGRVYEVWVRHGAVTSAPSPTSALFSPTASGAGTVAVPGNLKGVSQILVTSEPEGGSLSPTREPVIVAHVS